MKIFKRILPIVFIVVVVGMVYSFFHISGWEIKNINKLSDAGYVTVVVRNESNDEKREYTLNAEQTKLLQNLLKENSYTRRLTSAIIGVLPENEYTILADWNDNGKTNLYIKILGNEYISFFDYLGTNYHKIKNSDFEKELISILEAK